MTPTAPWRRALRMRRVRPESNDACEVEAEEGEEDGEEEEEEEEEPHPANRVATNSAAATSALAMMRDAPILGRYKTRSATINPTSMNMCIAGRRGTRTSTAHCTAMSHCHTMREEREEGDVTRPRAERARTRAPATNTARVHTFSGSPTSRTVGSASNPQSWESVVGTKRRAIFIAWT